MHGSIHTDNPMLVKQHLGNLALASQSPISLVKINTCFQVAQHKSIPRLYIYIYRATLFFALAYK
uniref:Uncharacterized protein n=1 Tax=Arundo donax TaxID=35708 RepID=A0A0A9FB64_ARUDO